MIKQYRKKPVVIEAVQWTGENRAEIAKFMENPRTISLLCFDENTENYGYDLIIQTLEGEMRADQGDYIIKGVRGEFYPCKPDIFEATYDEVEV